MYKSYKFVVAALVATSFVKTTDIGGLGGSISQEGVNSMTSILTPYIFANIKDVKIPEIDFDGGNLKNIDIAIPAPTSIDDVKLDLVNADNALELVATDLQATLNADFTYKYIVTVGGQAKVDIKKMNIDLELAMSTQPGTPATDLAPMVTVSKVDVKINPDDIDIKLSGSLVSKIASVFIPFFKSTIIPMIISDLEDQVKSIVNDQVDKDLAEYGTQAEIPYLAGVTFDYGQMNSGIVVSTDSVLSGAVNGTFFDAEKVQASAYTPTAFNVRDPQGKMLQAYISDYVLNTAFEAGFLTGNTLDLTYLLSKYLNVTVTTDNLGVIVPEILTKYGSGKAVGLAGKFSGTQTESKFTKEGQTLTGSLAVTVSVDNETAIQVEFDKFSLAAVLSSTNGAIYGNISESSVGTVSQFTTTLGITSDQFLSEVQGSVDTNIATLNQLLAAGVVIPQVAGIDISDLDLDFFDGYLEFGISVSPTFWRAVWDLSNFGALPIQEEIKIQNEDVLEAENAKFLQV